MSVINAIYKTEPTIIEGANMIVATIDFNGQQYCGYANCHPDDEEFFSKYVGSNIAVSRAIISALMNQLFIAKTEAKYKQQMYLEATEFGTKDINEIDPTGAFKAKVDKANNRVQLLTEALKKENYSLNRYLKDLDKTINTLRRNRQQGKTE